MKHKYTDCSKPKRFRRYKTSKPVTSPATEGKINPERPNFPGPEPLEYTDHTLQFKRMDDELLRRVFVDGFPVEDEHGRPFFESRFLDP